MPFNTKTNKELLIGALFGAIAGGTLHMLIKTKSGKKLSRNAEKKYREARHNVEDLLHFLEKKVSKNVHKHADKWREQAKDALATIKGHLEALDLSEHKELGLMLLGGALIGLLLGAAGAYASHGQRRISEEDIFKNTGLQASEWKPIVLEFGKLIEKHTHRKGQGFSNYTVEDVVHFAEALLQLWNSIKKKHPVIDFNFQPVGVLVMKLTGINQNKTKIKKVNERGVTLDTIDNQPGFK